MINGVRTKLRVHAIPGVRTLLEIPTNKDIPVLYHDGYESFTISKVRTAAVSSSRSSSSGSNQESAARTNTTTTTTAPASTTTTTASTTASTTTSTTASTSATVNTTNLRENWVTVADTTQPSASSMYR